MTIDEALNDWLPIIRQTVKGTEVYVEALEMAIKALEQQPTDAVDRVTIKEYLDSFGRYTNVTATDCIRRSDIGLTDFEIVMCNGDYKEGLKMLLDKIEKAPSVTPMPKMGAWEWLSYEGIDEGNWHCSECRMIIPRMPIDDDGKPLYKCCPFCGSKNRGDGE